MLKIIAKLNLQLTVLAVGSKIIGSGTCARKTTAVDVTNSIVQARIWITSFEQQEDENDNSNDKFH